MPAKNLIIVESPAKAKTISKFVGKDYIVRASMGHVRDLPKSKMGVDVEGKFEPTYIIPVDKKKVLKELSSHLGAKTQVWLATDEDREGEAIGWHLLKALKLPEDEHVKRIVFHEITKPAILHALETPRQLDHHLVDAQQARRVLDRLVGYELSPLLWKKVRYGLSAGRVQSVAVRFIVEREREIRAFKPKEYWSVTATYKHENKEFSAELSKIEDRKAEIGAQGVVDEVVKNLEGATHKVQSLDKKELKRTPPPPFTTSTLQQEAARKLGFSVKKTMTLAQGMYEGVDVFGDTMGIITYMRTDSVNLSELALKQSQEVITKEFGAEYGLPSPRAYKSKKGAQEAHEAIRPVDLSLHPQALKAFLDKDQYRLYELIWMRTIACQMKEAVLEQIGADISTEKNNAKLPYTFRATGQTVVFPGFMKAYTEGKDNPEEELEEGEKFLPELKENETLDLQKLLHEQHFTKPPPRYTEASLVKKLESEGIGRPSTYAPTISTIISRGYIQRDKKQLVPTDTAEVVTDMLVKHFPDIVDAKFTAKMEDDLDAIAEGKRAWVPVIKEFYDPFHHMIEIKQETIKKDDIVNEETKEKCEKCGLPMVIKLGRFGKFLSCSNYPKCKNARPLHPVEKSPETIEMEKKLAGKKCDKCGSPMVVKTGRFGSFLGCSKYPECKNIQSIVHFTGAKCQDCETGQLIERRTRKGGRVFYGCNKFPKCKFATWDKPVKNCDKCQKGVVVQTKEGGEKCLNCEVPPKTE
ncbi:type I DNA topoisomerase [Candidatus Peregrinibacteria bacterium]|nr:type I DNA topoisomerase [Candidatus Peregrinibacteria bacterium]